MFVCGLYINLNNRSSNEKKVGDEVCYGDFITISMIPELTDKSFYLFSHHLSHLNCSKFSKQQEVCFHPKKSSNTNWLIMFGDETFRYEYHGSPIEANSTVVIKHAFTHEFLASHNVYSGLLLLYLCLLLIFEKSQRNILCVFCC